MKLLRGFGKKKVLEYLLQLIHQIASAADQLASKISGDSSASRQNFLFSWMWPAKGAKTKFLAAHAIGNRHHDDVQNERNLGTNLSQLKKSIPVSAIN